MDEELPSQFDDDDYDHDRKEMTGQIAEPVGYTGSCGELPAQFATLPGAFTYSPTLLRAVQAPNERGAAFWALLHILFGLVKHAAASSAAARAAGAAPGGAAIASAHSQEPASQAALT